MQPRRISAVALVALLALTACGTKKTDAGASKTAAPNAATLRIGAPADRASVTGNVVELSLEVKGIDIVKADGDTSGKTGHFHVFVDRNPVAAGEVIPKEAGIVHAATNPVKISGLSVGSHHFAVVLGDGAHKRIGTALAETNVIVAGPAIDATAPATVKAGSPVVVTVVVQGVTLAKADGDTSGKTGHLHLFVDREPTAPGQAIPKEAGIIHSAESTIEVPGLATGEHTIWVVLGNGAHVPLSPPVMDQLTVKVG